MSRAQAYTLLRQLSDGRFHSGPELAAALGVSRTTVWSSLKWLEQVGIEVHAVSGKGYRLPEAVELLDAAEILVAMHADARRLLSHLEVHLELASTNQYLLSLAPQGASSGRVCFAERQSAGRGRRGRTWISPFGGNIYLSVLWRFPEGAASLGGLSPALGVAVTEALRACGIESAGIKWPNDVVWQGRKLAGILLEMAGESSGPCYVVAGIGVNINVPQDAAQYIDQPWVDVATILAGTPARNVLAGAVLGSVLRALAQFQNEGFASFHARWQALDAYAGKSVTIQLPNESVLGTAQGVDETGALLLSHASGLRSYTVGELSMRSVSE